jgi:hypothetical protein
MSDGKVKFTYFGDGSDLEKELVKLEKKHDDLTNRVGLLSKRSRQGSKSIVSGLVSQAKAALGAAAAYAAIKSAINAATEAQRKLNDSINQSIPKLDEMELKLQIQAGLTPKQVEGKIPQIKNALLETPSTDLAGGFQIQTQLVSSGFKQEDVDSGEALQTVLDLKAATALFGREVGNVKEAVSSVSQFLKATRQEATAANIRKTGGGMTQLFEGSEIQLADLSKLAASASGLTARGIDPQMQMAAFSVVRDQMEAPLAATAMTQVANEFGSAALDKRKVETLQSIGLEPADIDLIGEDLVTVMERLKNSLSNLDQSEANLKITSLVGKDAFKAAAAMINNADEIQDRLGKLEGGAFDRNLNIFRESRFADRQRVNIEREFAERDITKQRGGMTYQDVRELQGKQFAENIAQTETMEDRFKATLDSMIDSAFMSFGESTGQDPRQMHNTSKTSRSLVYSALVGVPIEADQPKMSELILPEMPDREIGLPNMPAVDRQPLPAAGDRQPPEIAVDNSRIEQKLDESKAESAETNRLLREQNELMKQKNPPTARPVNRNAQGE